MANDLTPGQAAMREAARLEAARVYGATVPEQPRRAPQPHAAPLDDSLYRPASPFEIAQLMRELAPAKALTRVTREAVEQAVARGLTPAEIAADLDVTLDVVARVMADMDRLAG